MAPRTNHLSDPAGRHRAAADRPKPGEPLDPAPDPAPDIPLAARPRVIRELMIELDTARAELARVLSDSGRRAAEAEVRATTAEAQLADLKWDVTRQRAEIMQRLQQSLEALATTERACEKFQQRAEKAEVRRAETEQRAAELSTRLAKAERRRADLVQRVHDAELSLADLRDQLEAQRAGFAAGIDAAELRADDAERSAAEMQERLRAALDTLTGVSIRVHERTRLASG